MFTFVALIKDTVTVTVMSIKPDMPGVKLVFGPFLNMSRSQLQL
jgi:hypothetical protein